jgi:iron complex transport system permease protein
MRRYLPVLCTLLLLSLLALSAAVLCGSTGCLRVSASADNVALLLSLRVPRALTAFAVGGALALSGALMQVLLRNPLADPYVLGLSGDRPPAPCWPCWRHCGWAGPCRR